jgi:2-oxoglutarate dehydrogenase E2 component (dihydrolipoamide succinyltransferase)
MSERGVSVETVAALGLDVVKRVDVERLLEPAAEHAGGAGEELSAHQATVARNVAISHATIPSAFAVVKVSMVEPARRQRSEGERNGAVVGLPELVIRAVARQLDAYPNCFATVSTDLRVTRAKTADVGVTIDVGTGLYVPVVRDAARLDLADIATHLARLRLRAMRGTIKADDLTGARITLSLQTDPDIVLARPIVFPGQTCALALCSTQRELHLDDNGQVGWHEFFHLGLAYDHRLINGREATSFLTAIRSALQTPES